MAGHGSARVVSVELKSPDATEADIIKQCTGAAKSRVFEWIITRRGPVIAVVRHFNHHAPRIARRTHARNTMPLESQKSLDIRNHFAPLIGNRIIRYETAELLHVNGTWGSWPDLPIRIFTDSELLVSISWSRFDDLWLSNDKSLPFVAEESTTRWVTNEIPSINGCVGRMIHHVLLGRGEMSIEGRDIEIWTRLVIDLGDCWLEIFNALDENGYSLHDIQPVGEFINCL